MSEASTKVKTKAVEEKPLKSPCVSICVLNEEDVCVGCFRSGNEISHWGSYNNEQKRAVLNLSVERSRKANPFL